MTRFNFTLTGYIDLAEPLRASAAAGQALSLRADGTTTREMLEPDTALHALLVSAIARGLEDRDLGVHDVRWTGSSVTVEP